MNYLKSNNNCCIKNKQLFCEMIKFVNIWALFFSQKIKLFSIRAKLQSQTRENKMIYNATENRKKVKMFNSQ